MSISLKNPLFEFSIHIPHFVAVTVESGQKLPDHLDQLDLSFIEPSTSGLVDFRIYKVRFSFLMCGSGYCRYNGYACVDTYPHPSLELLEDRDFWYDCTNPGGEDTGVHEDPIVSGCLLDANKPKHDAREYGVLVFKGRVGEILVHWKNVIGKLTPSFTHYVRCHLCLVGFPLTTQTEIDG
jgi:hypothetical protein